MAEFRFVKTELFPYANICCEILEVIRVKSEKYYLKLKRETVEGKNLLLIAQYELVEDSRPEDKLQRTYVDHHCNLDYKRYMLASMIDESRKCYIKFSFEKDNNRYCYVSRGYVCGPEED